MVTPISWCLSVFSTACVKPRNWCQCARKLRIYLVKDARAIFLKLLTCLSQWSQLPKTMKECEFLNKKETSLSYFWTVRPRIYNSMQTWFKTTRNALAVMGHFSSATLDLRSSVGYSNWHQVLFDVDMSQWDEALLCQSLCKSCLRAVIHLKN